MSKRKYTNLLCRIRGPREASKAQVNNHVTYRNRKRGRRDRALFAKLHFQA